MSHFPEGWAITTLEEAGKWGSGGTPSRRNPAYFGKGVPWIKSGDLPDGPILYTEEQITELGLANSSAKLMPAGTISIALYGATIGKLGVLTFPAATNQACANIIPDLDIIDPKYVFYYLLSERRKLIEKGQGGAQPNISQEILKSHPLALAPLNEQRLIVEKLEKLLGKVVACKKRLEKIPLILKRFRQSILAAACSGRLTADWRESNLEFEPASSIIAKLVEKHERAGGHKRGNAAPPTDDVHDLEKSDFPETWELTELRNLCEPDRPITYGILKPGPDIPDGVPYIRVADFPSDKLDITKIKRTTKEIDAAYARARLKAGDILLSIRGTVGRVCVIPIELSGANITQDSARLSIQDAVDSGFIVWLLRAMPTQQRMQKAVKGVAIRGINIGDVRALQIPIPPLAEQQEIVRRVEALFKLADQIEERYNKAKAYVDKLAQSILAKAFRGELVPQDPNDEPASVLLERIHSQRATSEPTNKKARTLSNEKQASLFDGALE